jgi:hypothetical protein
METRDRFLRCRWQLELVVDKLAVIGLPAMDRGEIGRSSKQTHR